MGRWFLVRHAQTEWNAEGRAQGHSEVGLSGAGQRQAQQVALRLASVPLAAAYSSDLSQALTTAKYGLQGRGVPLRAAPELRELAYGVWEGMTYREIQAQYPDLYAQLLTAGTAFAPPGGESVQHLVRRVDSLVSRVSAAHAGDEENILVVGHGGSLRALIVVLLGLPVSAFWRFQVFPASLSIVSLYPDGATLDLWNDTSHLEAQHG